MEQKQLEKLLEQMTLEEKVGQMIQVTGKMLAQEGNVITGPTETVEMSEEMKSMVGSVLNIRGAEKLRQVQAEFIQKHPHHIPLLTMLDVVNGLETAFPIPLAQGCTFSPELAEQVARASAVEAAATGIHVTFAPMLDLTRDPRWGRVMEGTGEDPFLNSEMGRAAVRGFQGSALHEAGSISGCVKHFAGYGLPDGGRDYDNVEISRRTLMEDYMPAYRAAIEEGCAMVMTSFNTYDRIPSSGNRWLLRDVLRKDMGFDGVVISDYSAVEEMVCHGIAEDSREAALLAIRAGVDIDMVSSAYAKHLADLVRCGEVEETLIDEAVMRILKLKNALGLFEDPYQGASAEKEAEVFYCDAHRALARKVARASFVLLKNESILPLCRNEEKIAVIGPYSDTEELFGAWSNPVETGRTVTVKQGIEAKKPGCVCVPGSYILDMGQLAKAGRKEDYTSEELEERIREAVAAAKDADKVILCLGEHRRQSGECSSRAHICLPENQVRLLQEVSRVNPNVVTLIFSGRPLELGQVLAYSKAVMLTWMPGTEGGNAVADVLFGDAVPEGKLTMSIPRTVGQIPVYYNHFATGRPNPKGEMSQPATCYTDEKTSPLFPFGYGLSYTTFAYSDVRLSQTEMDKGSSITASVTVTNTGTCAGTETVQLYLQDIKGSVVRPVKMLRGFQKVTLQPGQQKKVSFAITEPMLRFYDIDMHYTSEPGAFRVYIGTDSDTDNQALFHYREKQ
jgi:beta-glucosidase